MWLGNAAKDTFCLPRPRALSKARLLSAPRALRAPAAHAALVGVPARQAVRVIAHTSDSKENADEYGLPSTHVGNGLCFFAFALLHTGWHTHRAAQLALAVWTGLVALGRLYLGACWARLSH